ncbi:type II and III secretion system protein family protein [Phenylobacterium soli]|uniref:Type II and III secretion system protein family protein n=1 Tax=Phenylobacterium soli TaxID=2170551 RepID=A0A328AB70_9CAUL|nr:type II and III secretion system protein family protein [Phenylobacterium soli]RAK51825.1 type II and III secretion system protein family protein [Phenylobacterium soli]
MKAHLAALAVLAAGLGLQAPARAHAAAEVVADAGADMKLELGKGRLIKLSRPAATVFLSDPKVADLQVKSPTLVYLVGKAPGATSFFALDGKEQTIANLTLDVGVDETRLREMIAKEAPNSEVSVASANGALVLSGKAASAAEGEDILRIAALFVGDRDKPGQIVNRMTVETPNQVYLSVRIAEVSRDATRELGFNWESMANIGQAGGFLGWATGQDLVDTAKRTFTRPTNGAGTIVGGIYNPAKGQDINVLIDALQRKNLVSILAEPNLTAVSGEPANFLAGGEYPIPVPQGNGQTTITYKTYGVSLSFVATILDANHISLKVKPEVSQLSTAGSITLGGITVPALTTRRAETTVDLGSGQSFAIAGLMQNTATQDLQKLPGVGDIPVLGQLFRSRSFQKNESELVIIVTPYLVKPTSRHLAGPADHPAAAPVQAAAEPAKTATPAAPEKKG